MSSEFKQQLKTQMHAREVSSFDSWSRYLMFVTAVQRAVHSESGSSLDDAIKDGKKKIRSLLKKSGRRAKDTRGYISKQPPYPRQ